MNKCKYCGNKLENVEKLDKKVYSYLKEKMESIADYKHPKIFSCINCRKFFVKLKKEDDELTEMIGIKREESTHEEIKPNIKVNTLGYSNATPPSELDEKTVHGILSNIVYVGIGYYEQVIDEEIWIKTAKILLQKDGIDQFLANIIECVEKSFNVVFTNRDIWIQNSKNKIEEIGVEDFLRMYIVALRDMFRVEITSPTMRLPELE